MLNHAVRTRKQEMCDAARRFKQTEPLETRLAEEAKRLRQTAKLHPPGAVREAVLRKARHAETGSHMSKWLQSPGLRPPE